MILFKANFKIQAAKLAYEIYSLTQRLRYTTFRAENEEKVSSYHHTYIKSVFFFSNGLCFTHYQNFPLQRREQVEKETRILREKISVLKIHISTITKGVPISKIEVREDKRSVVRSSSPEEKLRSVSVPASGN